MGEEVGKMRVEEIRDGEAGGIIGNQRRKSRGNEGK